MSVDHTAWLTQLRAYRAGAEETRRADCLDDDLLAALAEGSLDRTGRMAGLLHLAECETCRRAVASLTLTLADAEVSREVAVLDRPARRGLRRVGGLGLIVATAAAILFIVWTRPLEQATQTHRAPPITAAEAPEAVGPVGAVPAVRTFRWTPVAGADRYRLTLYDTDGVVRYEVESAEVAVTLADSVALMPGATYFWKVDARLGFDRWASSTLTEFSIESPDR